MSEICTITDIVEHLKDNNFEFEDFVLFGISRCDKYEIFEINAKHNLFEELIVIVSRTRGTVYLNTSDGELDMLYTCTLNEGDDFIMEINEKKHIIIDNLEDYLSRLEEYEEDL